jgi:glycosyltransferase involved in cell wall biosynthesis
MSKTSVLFINRVYPPARGASGRMLRDLARAMAEKGWAVSVLTTGEEAGLEKDGAVDVIRVKAPHTPRGVFDYGVILMKLALAAMTRPKADLVVSMTDPPMLILAGAMFAQFKKCRHVHWCQDLYPDLLPAVGLDVPKPLLEQFKKITRRAMRRCDKVITIGRCMARQLTLSGVAPSRIAVIPNWPDQEILSPSVDNDAYKPFLVKNPDAIRPVEQQIRDDSPKFRVLYAGNLGKAHPVKSLLEAAAGLSHYPEIEFCFVGEGQRYERLGQERAKRGLDNVKLLPYQPIGNLRYVMESGDIHIVTMRDDAAGLLVPCKFYSAMAVGRPCIFVGPEDSEIATVIRDFAAGTVVPPRDPQRLIDAILDYRMNGENWFSAQRGAQEAGRAFIPAHAIDAWIARAEESLMEPI